MASTPLSTAQADQELVESFSAATTIDLHRLSVWETLCDTSYDQTGVFRTVIQDPTYGNEVTTPTAGRGGAWKASKGVASSAINLVRDQEYEVVSEVPYEDPIQAPWPILEQNRQDAAAKTAIFIDDNIAAYVAGLTYAAGDKFSVGSGNANALTLTGPDYEKGNGGRLVETAIDQAALRFYRKNIQGISVGGGQPGMLFAVMAPEVFRVLRQDLQDRRLDWDMLTDQMFDNRIRSTAAWSGRLYGIDIIVTNSLSVPASGSDWKIYFGTRKAIASAMNGPSINQILTPQTNQTSRSWVMRQHGYFGRVRVNPQLLEECTLNTVDS